MLERDPGGLGVRLRAARKLIVVALPFRELGVLLARSLTPVGVRVIVSTDGVVCTEAESEVPD